MGSGEWEDSSQFAIRSSQLNNYLITNNCEFQIANCELFYLLPTPH
ncbi:MAG: hypothetical protein KME64_44715 [Scytonematopsis contorta HA4267-MV1]|nr:hypothetical protein [Scytonematopsis contorta HA4267-MV1]